MIERRGRRAAIAEALMVARGSEPSGLFDDPPVPGLRYRSELLPAPAEPSLVAQVRELDFKPFEFQRWQGKRRVVSFGWHYDFSGARLVPAPPLPGFLAPLRAGAAAFAEIPSEAFEQVLIVEYPPGAGIGWHRDRPVFGVVVGVSLLSPCTLRLRHRDGRVFARATLALAPRSAYALTGAARHDWEHSIAPMATLRYSITFRTLRAPAAR